LLPTRAGSSWLTLAVVDTIIHSHMAGLAPRGGAMEDTEDLAAAAETKVDALDAELDETEAARARPEGGLAGALAAAPQPEDEASYDEFWGPGPFSDADKSDIEFIEWYKAELYPKRARMTPSEEIADRDNNWRRLREAGVLPRHHNVKEIELLQALHHKELLEEHKRKEQRAFKAKERQRRQRLGLRRSAYSSDEGSRTPPRRLPGETRPWEEVLSCRLRQLPRTPALETQLDCVPVIRNDHIAPDTIEASQLRGAKLAFMESQVQHLIRGKKKFKLGLTNDPVRRWREMGGGGYAAQGYNTMWVLLASSNVGEAAWAETALIRVFQYHEGCGNKPGTGGEGHNDDTTEMPHFTYLVTAI